jgi:hypothetical protein
MTSDTTNGTITGYLLDDTGTADTGGWGNCSLTPATAYTLASPTWTTSGSSCTITSSNYAANGIITLRLLMQAAASGGTTEVGNVTVNYNSAY